MHPVEASQKGRLPAAGRADQGRYRVFVNRKIYLLQGMDILRNNENSSPFTSSSI